MILDTNALSAWAEGNPACRPFFEHARRVVVPIIVVGEYLYGVRQSRFRERYESWLGQCCRMPSWPRWHPLPPTTTRSYACS